MDDTLWHVTRMKRLLEYQRLGMILAPVRAWTNLDAAGRFSFRVGRRVIIRLKDNGTFVPLGGHGGEAVISYENYPLLGINLVDG